MRYLSLLFFIIYHAYGVRHSSLKNSQVLNQPPRIRKSLYRKLQKNLIPVKGYMNWYGRECDFDITHIIFNALALLQTELAYNSGYVYVDIDDCWNGPLRNSEGKQITGPKMLMTYESLRASFEKEKLKFNKNTFFRGHEVTWSEFVQIGIKYFLFTKDGTSLTYDYSHGETALSSFVKWIHDNKLRTNIYTSVGQTTCYPEAENLKNMGGKSSKWRYVALLGNSGSNEDLSISDHTETDIYRMKEEWGFDGCKFDGCYSQSGEYSQEDYYNLYYSNIANFIDDSSFFYSCSWPAYLLSHGEHDYSQMPLNVVDGEHSDYWKDKPVLYKMASFCNMWRNYYDIGNSRFSLVINMHYFARRSWSDAIVSVQRPGAFNDPDMLVIGTDGSDRWYDGGTRITRAIEKIQFLLWCFLNSPLLLSIDIYTFDEERINLLKNNDLLSINEDVCYPMAISVGEFPSAIYFKNGVCKEDSIYNHDKIKVMSKISKGIVNCQLTNSNYPDSIYHGVENEMGIFIKRLSPIDSTTGEAFCDVNNHGGVEMPYCADVSDDRIDIGLQKLSCVRNHQVQPSGMVRFGILVFQLGLSRDDIVINITQDILDKIDVKDKSVFRLRYQPSSLKPSRDNRNDDRIELLQEESIQQQQVYSLGDPLVFRAKGIVDYSEYIIFTEEERIQ